jgi:hypothetical protein
MMMQGFEHDLTGRRLIGNALVGMVANFLAVFIALLWLNRGSFDFVVNVLGELGLSLAGGLLAGFASAVLRVQWGYLLLGAALTLVVGFAVVVFNFDVGEQMLSGLRQDLLFTPLALVLVAGWRAARVRYAKPERQ